MGETGEQANRSHYDVVILGGGSAGIVSGVLAGSLGLRVLLIEKFRMGGECLNTGCVPSKALIHGARIAWEIRHADRFGLPASTLPLEASAGPLQWARQSVNNVREADATEALLRESGVEIRMGEARFLNGATIDLDGKLVSADHFILATGSRPVVPAIPGLKEAGFLTSNSVFDLPEAPRRFAVVGGGSVGVELAQAFHRLGSQVTLIQRASRLLPDNDLEAAQTIARVFESEGIDLRLGRELIRVETSSNGKKLLLQARRGTETVEADEILVAVGRQPNVEGLALDRAGVRLETTGKRRRVAGVRVDGTLHTSGRRVWACGDVIGRAAFSHMAEQEAKLVVMNLFLPFRQRMNRDLVPAAVFTDPEMAGVGLTEEEATDRALHYEVSTQPFSQDDRAIVDGEPRGFVKVLSVGTLGKIIGAHIVGPRAGELIQEFVLAMERGLSVRDIADLVHVYPTLSVANQRASQRWYEARVHDPRIQAALSAYRAFRPAIPPMKLAAGVAIAALASRFGRKMAGRPDAMGKG